MTEGSPDGARKAGAQHQRPRLSVAGTGPSITPRPPASPAWPLRYELLRATGVRTGWLIGAVSLAVSLVAASVLGLVGQDPASRVFAGWLPELPLPPAAVAAGIFGALSFGQEFRYPALGFARGPVDRRLALLTAKLIVSAAFAVALSMTTLLVNAAAVRLLFGTEPLRLTADGVVQTAGWVGIVAACGWAGVISAGLFRSTVAGVAAVLGIPLVLLPAVRMLTAGTEARSMTGSSGRFHLASVSQAPAGNGRWVNHVDDLLAWSVLGTGALALAVSAGLVLIGLLRGGVRQPSSEQS